MKAFIRYLGVIDKDGATHAVAFQPGVNVVTGKSSTGKSALIEIFDFCFGSSDFTVPEGIITQRASLYFCILALKEINLVLARSRNEPKAFLREASDLVFTDPVVIPKEYFEPGYYMNLYDFKKELGRYFGLTVTNPSEDETNQEWTGNRKANAPSIRSFTSFMLQHQNLVANKHAIFYRFDEKEKRDQVIEHFKIFAGFANQDYFLKSQELHKLQAQQKRLEILIPKAAEVKKKAAEEIDRALLEYWTISGVKIDLGATEAVVNNPTKGLRKLTDINVKIVPDSNEHALQKKKLEDETALLTANLRKTHNRLSEINSSIQFALRYAEAGNQTPLPAESVIKASQCPFCQSEHSAVENEANKLLGAIEWLNMELERSPYLLESFQEAEKKVQEEAQLIRAAVDKNAAMMTIIDHQIAQLAQHKSQYELSLRAKYKLEAILNNLVGGKDKLLEQELNDTKVSIKTIQHQLKSEYDIDAKFAVAESTIAETMAEIGQRFDFEASYRPIKLRFSLSNFNLWHDDGHQKILLRSMGSGANWLYSHVTLFLALHRYFCSLGDRCSIPSILFFDQPSQVYFPSALDTAEEFSPKDLAKKEGDSRSRPIDDDITAVSNLYDQLVSFCAETERKTGIMPQVIVTDHADHLKLNDGQSFETLVKARWRTRGFIADRPVQEKPSPTT